MNTISFESWCETQPCSKMPCANHKACRKGWRGALQMVTHNYTPSQLFYNLEKDELKVFPRNESGQVFYIGERTGVGVVEGAAGIPGIPFADLKTSGSFRKQPDLPYESLSKREQRIIDQFIEDNEDLVTHEAMIDLYANLLKPKWYHHWLFWVIIMALASGVGITIGVVLR